MNSDLLATWTAIITNIAVVVGLAFVGLEFRNNTKAIEAERIDSFIQGVSDNATTLVTNGELSEILFQAYADPGSVVDASLDRLQNLLILNHNNFRRMYLQHQSGLISEEMYEYEKRAVGFSFSSDAGLDFVALMSASALGDEIWDIIEESATQARAYCLNPENSCVARFESARKADS